LSHLVIFTRITLIGSEHAKQCLAPPLHVTFKSWPKALKFPIVKFIKTKNVSKVQ